MFSKMHLHARMSIVFLTLYIIYSHGHGYRCIFMYGFVEYHFCYVIGIFRKYLCFL